MFLSTSLRKFIKSFTRKIHPDSKPYLLYLFISFSLFGTIKCNYIKPTITFPALNRPMRTLICFQCGARVVESESHANGIQMRCQKWHTAHFLGTGEARGPTGAPAMRTRFLHWRTWCANEDTPRTSFTLFSSYPRLMWSWLRSVRVFWLSRRTYRTDHCA